jgi:murein DD-endopeptidase MepM/ murein hydrolase activator NlpD
MDGRRMPGTPQPDRLALSPMRNPERTMAAGRSAMVLLAAVLVLAGGCSIPRWPVRGPVTSGYGIRMHGLLPGMHDGVDIRVPDGTPVAAMKSGRVRWTGTMRGYGLTVILDHGPNLQTLYAHLSAIDVVAGQEVEGRQVIARSGHSGDATGPHLHFEVIRWGRPDDPVPLLGGFPN